jgi:hypothetical protein
MTEQLRLFALTADELARKASLVVELHRELAAHADAIKEAQEQLRESSEYLEVQDLRKQVKAAKEQLATIMSELGAAKRD